MEPNESYKKLVESKEFKAWQKKHPKAYLSYSFMMQDEEIQKPWQFGFYEEKEDKITPFNLEKNKVIVCTAEDIFKREDDKVKKLELNKAKINLEKLFAILKKAKKQKYPNELESKKIYILQNLNKLGLVWNVTYVTCTFNTINFKINATNGKILEDKLVSLFDFRKKE